jgi:hypothetical protein
MGSASGNDQGDEWTDRLSRLFLAHPAWVEIARRLRQDASSSVYFSHREREPWRLVRCDDETHLIPGADPDPDFVFRFTPESIEALESVEGGVGDFAVTLFSLVVDGAVELRIVAGFPRLMTRGYLRLLLAAGPPVLVFGARHGIRTIGALRRFVAQLRERGPAEWEQPAGDDDTPTS